MTAVEMVGQGVEVGLLGNRRVESGVEYRDLRLRLTKDLLERSNSAEVVGVMKRCEIDTVLDSL
jgi:hypothetical protein